MKIRKAVILAAGFGTRFLPATKAMPKEMMPVIDKPVIQYVVEECVQSGLEDIIIVTSESKRAIKEHFDKNAELEGHLSRRGDTIRLKQVQALAEMAGRISYVKQGQAAGVPDAIYAARSQIGSEPFAVLFGDDILIPRTKPHIRQLIEIAEKKEASCVGATKVPKEDIHKFGVFAGTPIQTDLWQLTDIIEKPPADKAPSDWVSNGRYAFTNEYLGLIPDTPIGAKDEKHWPDVAKKLMRTQKMYAKLFDGYRYSVGDRLEFIKATVELALKRDDMRDDLKAYLKQLKT